jgi:hypothetical protein
MKNEREVILKEREIFFRPESYSPGFPEVHVYFRSEFGYESMINPELRCPTL